MKKQKSKTKKIMLWVWIAIGTAIVVYVAMHSSSKTVAATIHTLTKIIILVGVASFLGALFEYRAWTRFIMFIAAPVVKLGKLSSVSGTAFITAVFSNNAANTLIAGSCREGNISRREMIISGLCNSFPAMVSHSLRIFFPLFGLVGMAAVWYYSFTFGVGLLMTIAFLLISRFMVTKEEASASDKADSPEIAEQERKIERKVEKVADWNAALKKSAHRAVTAVWRIFIVTTPIYMLVGYMSHHHMFDFYKKFIPNAMQSFLSPEIMTVLSARLGGLTAAASAASGYLNNGKMEVWQVVLAFLIGNIITNPIRTVRRNLPAATGIFPGRDGVWIVLTLQSLRLLTAVIAIAVMILWNRS